MQLEPFSLIPRSPESFISAARSGGQRAKTLLRHGAQLNTAGRSVYNLRFPFSRPPRLCGPAREN